MTIEKNHDAITSCRYSKELKILNYRYPFEPCIIPGGGVLICSVKRLGVVAVAYSSMHKLCRRLALDSWQYRMDCLQYEENAITAWTLVGSGGLRETLRTVFLL